MTVVLKDETLDGLIFLIGFKRSSPFKAYKFHARKKISLDVCGYLFWLSVNRLTVLSHNQLILPAPTETLNALYGKKIRPDSYRDHP
jgi:hypothetical protein